MNIYSLEITSQCNLNCSYCPQPTMQRAKEHMSVNRFKKALDYPFWFNILTGHQFGEAFMHPDLAELTELAHKRNLAFGFSSNMRDFDLDYFYKLQRKGLSWMVISFHIPEARQWYQYFSENLPEFPLLSSDLEQKHNWAGQVDKDKKANQQKKVVNTTPGENTECLFHQYNLASVNAQGDILACCLDSEGISKQGSLFDYTPQTFSQMENNIYFDLCNSCPLRYNQETLKQTYAQYAMYATKVFEYRKNLSKTESYG